MVQCLGLGTFTAEGMGSIPSRGTKTPHAVCCGQNNNNNKKKRQHIIAMMRTGFETKYSLLQIQAVPLANHVTLNKLLNLVLRFPFIKMDNKT